MSGTTANRVTNRLIAGLPCQDRERVLTDCVAVELPFGDILCEPDKPLRYVYFPLTGFISFVAAIGPRQLLEVGLVGNEGMLGATLALGVVNASRRGVVQGEGSALRMTAAQLERALCDCPALRRTVNRYLYVLMAQLLRNNVCTHYHEIRPRLARWLLMTHDRVDADHFHVTHEFLASMLGVRRSGVTVAAGALQQCHLIQYSRGNMIILDRYGLEASSCDCYEAMLDDYARQLS